MSGLVLELQKDAMDAAVPVSALLRKALVVSRKLGLTDMSDWIDSELNGYKADDESLPEYRWIRGELKARNPYHGWIPLYVPKRLDFLTCRNTNQSITEIENLIGGDGTLCMPFSNEVQQQLMASMEVPLQPAFFCQRTDLVRIADAVRNTILEWALKLESEGVLGHGLSFSAEEKGKALSAASGNTYQHIQHQTVIGSMHDSQLQQGTQHSSQNYQKSSMDSAAIAAVIAQIREAIATAALSPDLKAEVVADLATVEAQAKAPRPKDSILRESFRSVRTILESAVGGALGNAAPALPGAIDAITKILG
ncbi:hypothetical protein DFLDMN_006210 (plasmid) [Cupriavidus sp. H19C3]|uniref:AbiTii domain-containing protein n=1 Tax=Cupriavidus sp. H19C3 TaxID=3241603 RepID=UPI003BF86536